MNKKIAYLFLALLLPPLIFVFLKYFGKNEFDIPVYYNEGISEMSRECQSPGDGQYYVPDSALRKWNWKEGNSVLISLASEKTEKELNQLVANAKFERLQLASIQPDEQWLKNCVLFMKEPWNAVLIDNQKRIRGYYKIGYRDEMDRLEVELKILLKKY